MGRREAKKKLGLFKRVKKQIDKLALTDENLGCAINQFKCN
tara:strand:- start:2893 stop:3015 length:123 start_codon:yes stop_codon:yes gene_type:complete